jgi:hypothetical protein
VHAMDRNGTRRGMPAGGGVVVVWAGGEPGSVSCALSRSGPALSRIPEPNTRNRT